MTTNITGLKQKKKRINIFLKYRSPNTLAGIVTNAGSEDESWEILTLDQLKDASVGMRSTVIIGNQQGIIINNFPRINGEWSTPAYESLPVIC